MIQYLIHFSTYQTACTDAYKTYRTITVYTKVFLKMNARFQNTKKTTILKI